MTAAHRKSTAFQARACPRPSHVGLSAALLLMTLNVWAAAPIARVAQGALAGSTADGVLSFRGIPYASPPVGPLRWRPPAAMAPWSGVRIAVEPGPECPTSSGKGTEDCLYLDVWTTALRPRHLKPVMVWMFGSGFRGGSPNRPIFNGAALARQDVVLVTINNRSGILGYLTLPELTAESPQHSSGNYGLLDAIAALRWVKANIRAFGGDAGRITFFGQSSGSETVNILTASPLAKNLFQRAIGESGGSFGQREPKTLEESERLGSALLTKAGASSLADLRRLSPAELMAASDTAFEPVIDGWLLPADVHAIFSAAHQNDVALLVGSNSGEPVVLGDYPATTWARLQTRTGHGKVFQYHFEHAPPPVQNSVVPPRTGAYHGAELPYVFGNLDEEKRDWAAEDFALQKLLTGYWVNFARHGDPNGAGLPHWPSTREQPGDVMVFDAAAHVGPTPSTDQTDTLEAKFYGAGGLFTDRQ